MSVPVELTLLGLTFFAAILGMAAAGRAIFKALRDGLFATARQRAEAEARAASLLQRQLTPSQRQQLAHDGYLDVPSPTKAGRAYRIPAGRGQVRIIEGSRPAGSLCIAPAGSAWCPASDVVLAHKLMIEGAEQQYLATANFIRAGSY